MSATSLDQHFQNGKGESLARARAALKGRLKHKMMQDVLEELQDTEHVVDEAMAAMTANEEALDAAKEAFKTRLHDQIRQQAVAEVVAEVTASNLDTDAEDPRLSEAKAAFKKRLFDHVIEHAISEVGTEIDETQEVLEAHGVALDGAKERFKARLRDHALEQAATEAGAEVNEAQDVLETHGDALEEAKESLKARLRDQVFEQAIDEVGAETASDELLAQVDVGALGGAKDALKHRLLDQVFQQAIAEIDAEVDVTEVLPDGLAASSEDGLNTDAPALLESISDITFDVHGEENAFSAVETIFPDEKAAFPIEDTEEAPNADDPIIDVQFWEDEDPAPLEADDASLEFSLPEGDPLREGDLLPEEDAQEDNDSNFFLDDLSEEAGGDGETAATEVWDEDVVEDLLDFAGDGAWDDSVPYTDSLAETQAESHGESASDVPVEPATEGLIYYVYGILPGNSTAEDALPLDGIDPAFPIYPVVHEHSVALVSRVSTEEYGPEALAINQLDPVWKEERAAAHQALVDLFSVDGLFLPVPFCTVYEHEDDVAQLFTVINYQDALDKIKGRAQMRVRLYRNVDVLHQQVVENSDAVQKLMADIKSKPKGGAHSIKKQMVSTIHEEEASLTDECTKDVHERLFGHADDVELGTLEGHKDRDKAELILDATYLVHEDKHRAFTDDIEHLVRLYATRGFEFDVTGPEPPTLFSQLTPFSKA